MNANKKYNITWTLDKKTNLIYDENGIQIPISHIIYEIVSKYKQLLYLEEIKIIPHTDLLSADNGLVYKGIDTKNREQYMYGVNYVNNRKEKKLKSFLNVHKKINLIEKNIHTELSKNEINDDFFFAAILLLELTFYIRLGKEKYFEENKTVGILTMKKKNIIKEKDKFIFSFQAKSSKEQNFVCDKNEHELLYKTIEKLYNNAKTEEDFLFCLNDKRFTERKLNYRLEKINLTLKNFRTYGVNIVFLKKIYDKLLLSDKTETKKYIKNSIEETANIIGHTKGISKKSYLSEDVINAVENFILKNEIKNKSFDSFLNSLLKYF